MKYSSFILFIFNIFNFYKLNSPGFKRLNKKNLNSSANSSKRKFLLCIGCYTVVT